LKRLGNARRVTVEDRDDNHPWVSRKSATIFGQGTIPEPSTPHTGREVALVAWTAAFVYI
jgi:hypothetical protein